MPYTTEDGGRLNNFAVEPKVYKAEPPTQKQRVQYFIWAASAVVLVGGLLAIAVSVS